MGGITAFVGANGSGKSNVVDAVQWCLGEQNMRDLRAQRSEDVIYAGPRRAVGVAEVVLTFEDEGEGEETEIARRLYRSGESEYLLNGERVRLRDITSALHQLGIDSTHSVVVHQGMADALLSATPVERRGLLEQAAGLSGYRDRRDQARQKLAATGRNVETAETILAELEPRLRMLRRQAKALEDRDEAAARLQQQLRLWYGARWADFSKRQEAATRAAQEEGGRRRDAEASLQLQESESHGHWAAFQVWQEGADLIAERLRSLETKHADACREIVTGEKRLDLLNSSLQSLLDRRERLAAARRDQEARLAALERELLDLEEVKDRLDQRVRQAEQTATQQRSAWEEADRELTALASEQQENEARRRRLQAEIVDAERRADSYEARFGNLEAEEATVQETLRSLQVQLEETQALLQTGIASRAELMERLVALEASRSGAASHARRVSRWQELLTGDVRRLEQQKLALRDALRHAESSQAASAVSHLRVPSGFERAIATSFALWVDLDPDANGGDNEREEFLAWRQTLFSALTQKGVWANDVVQANASQTPWPLLSTFITDSNPAADHLWFTLSQLPALRIGSPPVQVVTRDGYFRNAYGGRTSLDAMEVERYLLLKAEFDKAESRREDLSRRARAVEMVNERWAKRLGDLQGHVEAVMADLGRASDEVRALEDRRDAHEAEQRRLTAVLAHAQEERTELHNRRREADELASALKGERVRLTERGDELLVLAERSREDVAKRHEEWQTSRQQLEEIRDEERQALMGLASRQEVQRFLRRDRQRLDQELAPLDEEQAHVETEMAQVRETVSDRQRFAEARARDVEVLRRELADFQQQRPQGPTGESPLLEVRQRVAELVSSHERAKARLEQLEAEQRELREEIVRELQTEPESLPIPEEPPSAVEITRLRTRALQYAEIEPSVVEEYRELAQREAYLCENLEELREASRRLEEIMQVADGEMRLRFDRAFQDVGREFSRVFQLMLGGGEACLERVDDGHGVEIRAQLPGRRARSSAAFSGGERSLVASSLLFGVLAIRPTPFCILDEVDAALDETNVDRYLAALRDISERTQVILVTHNRATMAAADALYGLTMDDQGVSSLLSVRLDAYETAV